MQDLGFSSPPLLSPSSLSNGASTRCSQLLLRPAPSPSHPLPRCSVRSARVRAVGGPGQSVRGPRGSRAARMGGADLGYVQLQGQGRARRHGALRCGGSSPTTSDLAPPSRIQAFLGLIQVRRHVHVPPSPPPPPTSITTSGIFHHIVGSWCRI